MAMGDLSEEGVSKLLSIWSLYPVIYDKSIEAYSNRSMDWCVGLCLKLLFIIYVDPALPDEVHKVCTQLFTAVLCGLQQGGPGGTGGTN